MEYNSAITQNNRERLFDKLERKLMTADEANVQLVLQERVREVRNRLPAQVRKALNAAVKNGVLCHMKKDGIKPEVYYHPNFKHLAIEARNEHVRALQRALQATCSSPRIDE